MYEHMNDDVRIDDSGCIMCKHVLTEYERSGGCTMHVRLGIFSSKSECQVAF
jgi:hypothetical protein